MSFPNLPNYVDWAIVANDLPAATDDLDQTGYNELALESYIVVLCTSTYKGKKNRTAAILDLAGCKTHLLLSSPAFKLSKGK